MPVINATHKHTHRLEKIKYVKEILQLLNDHIYAFATAYAPFHSYVPCSLVFVLHAMLCIYVQLVMYCVPVSVYVFSKGAMHFIAVLLVVILLLLTSSPPKWRTTFLLLMVLATQPCTGQPKKVSCPWWSTWSSLVDLI